MSRTKPTVSMTNPPRTTGRVPKRWANGGTAGATPRITTAASGSIARPAARLENPSVAGSWKYRLSRKLRAAIAPAPTKITQVEVTSWMLLNTARSINGDDTRRSTATKPTAAITVRIKQARVGTEIQPQVEPSVIANTNGTRTPAISAVPAQSIVGGRFGSRDPATPRSAIGMQRAPTTASIQNRPCHPVTWSSTPPITGPPAAPAAAAAPHRVTARICAGPDEATESRLNPQARIVAPAAPWISRPRMTIRPVWASAISTHDATNRARPATKTRRRPKTSPIAPEVTITAAPTSRYPVTAHCRTAIGVCRSTLIEGSRMATAEVFAFTTSVDTQATIITPRPGRVPVSAVPA